MKNLNSFTLATAKALFVLAIFAGELAFAHKGIGIQAMLKKPDGTYPTATGLTVTLQVLDPSNNCVLREEVHSGVPITDGYLNLVLGSSMATTPVGLNPSPVLTIPEVMDNSTARAGLNCIDVNNAVLASGQTYTPLDTHARKVRLRTTILGDPIVADFNMRAIGFAVNAENLGGKAAGAFVQTSTAITQSNVQSIFGRYGALDMILNGTYAGNAATATALAAAPGACPAGQYLSAMSATGSITCGTPTGGSGSVTAVTSANSYLSVATGTSTPVLTVNVGAVANTVAAGNDVRFTDARTPTGTAGGDLSGTYPNPTVAKIAGKSVVLTSPANGEFLKYDGTNFVNSTVSTADATKLPLAGGTMSGAIDMNTQNLTNVGFVTMSANKSLHLSNNSSDPSGLVAADKGKIWFNTTSGEIKYWDGSAAQPLGVAGSGLSNFNTQTGTTQTLAIGASGTAPAWNSATNTHTLNIPMASTASVTAGLLSKTDYDAFNAKLGTATSFTGDVTGTSSTMSVDKIKGKSIAATTYASGQTLRYDGTSWINSVLSFADLGSKPTTLAGYGIADAQSSTLASGQILVGNGSNVATAVTMSGDATLSNTGALTLATVPISKGGTGLTTLASDKLITTSGAGAVQTTSCGLNQVISFTAGGGITCANVSALSAGFVNGGNSFAAAGILGTNDSFDLNLETNNTTRMTILSTGNVGVGTAGPTEALHVYNNTTSNAALLIENPNAGSNASARVVVKNNAGDSAGYSIYSSSAAVNPGDAQFYGSKGVKITSDAGMMSGGTNAIMFNTSGFDPSLERMRITASGNVGIGTPTPGTKLEINGTNGTTLKIVDGNQGLGKVLTSDANGVASWATASGGGGITSLGGLTAGTQTFAVGTSGTAPGFISSTSTHTLNIPMASTASVTAGLLSKTDYDAFNAKLGTSTVFAGDVTGTSGATSVDKIKGKAISATTYAAGQTLRYDGTDWVNSVLNFADLGSKPTTLAGYGITDAQSRTLASAKILVGNGSNVATEVAMSGDATISNTGAVTLATVPLTKGGTGVTSFAADKIITTSAAGALQATSCALNEVISFTAGGAITCVAMGGGGSGFANGGNSYAAAATLGTNDAYSLALETGGTTRMTILSDGTIGIGTATPTSALNVKNGSIVADSVSSTVAYINYGAGNVQMSSTAATTINICGLKDGGTYTLVLTGITDASTVTVNAYPTYVNSTSCSGTAMRVDLGAGLSTFTTMGNTNILSFVYFSSRGANGTVYGFPATYFNY